MPSRRWWRLPVDEQPIGTIRPHMKQGDLKVNMTERWSGKQNEWLGSPHFSIELLSQQMKRAGRRTYISLNWSPRRGAVQVPWARLLYNCQSHRLITDRWFEMFFVPISWKQFHTMVVFLGQDPSEQVDCHYLCINLLPPALLTPDSSKYLPLPEASDCPMYKVALTLNLWWRDKEN